MSGPDSMRSQFFFLAQVAEKAERWSEMKQHMTDLAKLHIEMTPEERNCLRLAFKFVAYPIRESFRSVAAVQEVHDEGTPALEPAVELTIGYKAKIASELEAICEEMHLLLDDHIFPHCHDPSNRTDFLRVKGDYHRFLAEVQSGESRTSAATNAEQSYEEALECASDSSLDPFDPILLGVALNFSVLRFEILNDKEGAKELAQDALAKGLASYERQLQEGEDDYEPDHSAVCILGYLKDNLELWKQSESEEPETEEEASARRKKQRELFDSAYKDKSDGSCEEEYRKATLPMQLIKDKLMEWMGESDDDDDSLDEYSD